MQIEKNKVATLSYTLKNKKGDLLDQADAAHPFVYLHGANNIVVGLESRLAGKSKGDQLTAIVPAEEAYGLRDENLTQAIPRKMFEGMDDSMLVAGTQFEAQTNAGIEVITISKVEGDTIYIDANHPLAGEELHFDIEVLDVREATPEELAHGHVHSHAHTSSGCGCGGGGHNDGGCYSGH